MNLIIWFVIAFITGKVAQLLHYPSARISDWQAILISEMGTFGFGILLHNLLHLGSLYSFSLISCHLAWSGAFIALLATSFLPEQLVKLRFTRVYEDYRRLVNFISARLSGLPLLES